MSATAAGAICRSRSSADRRSAALHAGRAGRSAGAAADSCSRSSSSASSRCCSRSARRRACTSSSTAPTPAWCGPTPALDISTEVIKKLDSAQAAGGQASRSDEAPGSVNAGVLGPVRRQLATARRSDVLERLAHRYPSLLVDAIAEHEPGKRHRRGQERHRQRRVFQGHFPGAPLMPAVLMIEALTQAATLLLLDSSSSAGDVSVAACSCAAWTTPSSASTSCPAIGCRLDRDARRGARPAREGHGASAEVDGQMVAEAELAARACQPIARHRSARRTSRRPRVDRRRHDRRRRTR